MKHLIVIALLWSCPYAGASAATCEEGVAAIQSISKLLELTDIEQSNVESLIVKAKIEQEQGHQRNCKIILADAIRFFLIRTAMEE